ncbi:MAG: hypothetical protein EOP53_02245 [Sphingobacteriales bacterium]|nr:MAG: hypothetical protein EOP53_02245 [Sphingobacteriales bacterium]
MENTFIEEKENTGGGFDFKRFLLKLLANYRWIILALLITLPGAMLYLRYQVAMYKVSAYILVGGKELESGANNILSQAGAIDPMGMTDPTAINNEIFILKSNKVIGQVVDSLRLDVAITNYGRIKNQPVDIDSLPFQIKF